MVYNDNCYFLCFYLLIYNIYEHCLCATGIKTKNAMYYFHYTMMFSWDKRHVICLNDDHNNNILC